MRLAEGTNTAPPVSEPYGGTGGTSRMVFVGRLETPLAAAVCDLRGGRANGTSIPGRRARG